MRRRSCSALTSDAPRTTNAANRYVPGVITSGRRNSSRGTVWMVKCRERTLRAAGRAAPRRRARIAISPSRMRATSPREKPSTRRLAQIARPLGQRHARAVVDDRDRQHRREQRHDERHRAHRLGWSPSRSRRSRPRGGSRRSPSAARSGAGSAPPRGPAPRAGARRHRGARRTASAASAPTRRRSGRARRRARRGSAARRGAAGPSRSRASMPSPTGASKREKGCRLTSRPRRRRTGTGCAVAADDAAKMVVSARRGHRHPLRGGPKRARTGERRQRLAGDHAVERAADSAQARGSIGRMNATVEIFAHRRVELAMDEGVDASCS